MTEKIVLDATATELIQNDTTPLKLTCYERHALLKGIIAAEKILALTSETSAYSY